MIASSALFAVPLHTAGLQSLFARCPMPEARKELITTAGGDF